MPKLKSIKRLFPQIAIAIVLFANLQCAVLFLVTPSIYAPAFELNGIPGDIAIKGFGILFVMWCIPYIFALLDPYKHRVSYLESIIMQAVGLIGESILAASIPPTHLALQSSLQRFIIFDGCGLILLIFGYRLLSKSLDQTDISSK